MSDRAPRTVTIHEGEKGGRFEIVAMSVAVKCPAGHEFDVVAPCHDAECPHPGCRWFLNLRARVSSSSIWFATERTAASYGVPGARKDGDE